MSHAKIIDIALRTAAGAKFQKIKINSSYEIVMLLDRKTVSACVTFIRLDVGLFLRAGGQRKYHEITETLTHAQAQGDTVKYLGEAHLPVDKYSANY